MSRKIKVLAYDIERKKQTNVGIFLGITGEVTAVRSGIKIVEYVGQNDCNNNEVYEGHVLRNTRDEALFNWVVSFRAGVFGITNIGVDGYQGDFFPINSNYYFEDREIVGHIYEKPELLKGR